LLRRLFRSLAIVCGMLLTVTTVHVGPAYAASPVGYINFEGYCRAQGRFVTTNDHFGGYGVGCISGTTGNIVPINYTDACRWTHGPNVIDRNRQFRIDGWYCWATSGLRGPLDLDRWCKHLGHVGAEAVGTTVFDWRCRTKYPKIPLVGIDVEPACHWQYGSGTIDRYADFHNRNTWECWG
jgi:hypothetical protein